MHGYKPDKNSEKIELYTEQNCKQYAEHCYLLCWLDILQGRSICRALWDYYKISGHVEGCEMLSEEVT